MMVVSTNIEDQIDLIEGLDISYRTLHETLKIYDKQTDREIIVPFRSITNDYKDFFENVLVSLTFEDYEKSMYRFNPKRLSDDLYGTTEFWNDILILNKCPSVIDFDLPNMHGDIIVYDPYYFKAILNDVIIMDQSITEVS
jgi:hypothetical protein